MKKLYRYFDNKNILITGGGGFIGTNLARRLVSNYNCNVTVADIRFIDWYLEDIDRKLEKIRVDIRDYWRCLKLTRRKDIVFHLSANMGGIGFIVTNRANVMRDNLRMNINMLEASKENNVERFFFSSSACVYPEEKQTTPDVKPLREEDAIPANPDTCFTPETIVYTQPEIKKIEEVKEGDKILSGDGTLREVKRIFKRHYDGKIRKIKTWMYNIPIRVTPNHPFLVAKRKKSRLRAFEKPRWLPAFSVKKGDALVIPIMKEIEEKEVDEGFLKLAGYYLAEGSIDHKKCFDKQYGKKYFNGWRVALWFSEKTRELMEDIEEYLKTRKIGFTKYQHKNLIGFEITSKEIARELEEFGKGAYNKKIPLWIMKLPKEKQRVFLDAYLQGDGAIFRDKNIGREIIVATTVSRSLAFQLVQMFLRQGYCPSITLTENKDSKLEGRVIKGGLIFRVKATKRKGDKKSNWASWIDNGFYYVLVRESREEDYSGLVYNSEISTIHSYTVGIGLVVHNSYGWEKLTTEKLCEAYYLDYELETRVARFHNIYGEYCSFDERGKAPAHLIGKALLYPRVRFTIWGDGRQTRSFCYIEDCLDAVLLLTSSDIREPLNIGSDRLVTIDELANMIIKISGKYIEKEYIETGIQGVRGRNADLTKIRQLLGWYPKYSLEEGLERTFTWALKNINRIDWSYLLRSVS